jgi:hypothetical protein
MRLLQYEEKGSFDFGKIPEKTSQTLQRMVSFLPLSHFF